MIISLHLIISLHRDNKVVLHCVVLSFHKKHLYRHYYQTTKICVKHAIKVECYHEVKWPRYCIYQSYHANCRHTACCRNYCTRRGDWNHGRHFQIRSCEKTTQHNAIQLYCLCVGKFTFWFLNYIKYSIVFKNKTSTIY